MLKCLIVLLVTIITTTSAELLLTTCSGYSTCSPAQCTVVTNPSCVSIASTINIPQSISAIPCSSSIQQSTNPICSQTSLFSKGFGFGIKAVYCTDQFLIIHSDGTPNHADTLNLIPRPPGDSSSGTSYTTQCVTRSKQAQFYTFKIPLTPVELPTAGLTNNINAFPTGSKLPTIALPKAGAIGVTLTGVPIYPAYNNNEQLTWLSCEMDACNGHVGQGFDYHYHGDPYGPNCMYSSSDYTSTIAHPPVIGFSLDGFKIYGRYLSQLAEGYSIALDECGGHSHGSYDYHYHAQVLSMKVTTTTAGFTAGQTYTAYIGGPYKCWKGDISNIKSFWDTPGSQAAYMSSRMSPGNLAQRSDYQYLRPSCSMTNYYAAFGVIFSSGSQTPIVNPPVTQKPSSATITQPKQTSQKTTSRQAPPPPPPPQHKPPKH